MSELYDLYVMNIDWETQAYWSGGLDNWLAQTFTPHVGYDISSVVLKNYRVGGSCGDVTVSIKATDIGTGKPTGPDLAFVTIDGTANIPAGSVPGDAVEITYTFSSPYSLVSGTKYAIVLKSPEIENRYIRWLMDSAGGLYLEGSYSLSTNGGTSWILDTGIDFYFKTYGEGLLVDYYKLGEDNKAEADVPPADDRQFAQTFTASSAYTITSVGLKIYAEFATGFDLLVQLQEVDGSGHPNGTVRASGTIVDADIGTSPAWEICTFVSGYALTNGRKYAIVAIPQTGSGKFYWRLNQIDATYSGGNYEVSQDAGGSWTAISGHDFMFETYRSPDVAPVITDQSTDTTVGLGEEVILSVTATGTPAPTYQWYRNDIVMSGETNSTLTIYPTSTATYKCIATNVAGSDESDPIIVTVVGNPYVYNLFSLFLDAERID